MINFNPPIDMVYEVPGTRQVIPYWLYLRILHLFSTSTFPTGGITRAASVASTVREDGYDISNAVLAALSRRFRALPHEEVLQLRNLDPAMMRPRYGGYPLVKINHQMEIITPRLTVPGNITGTIFEMSDKPAPLSDFPLHQNPLLGLTTSL